MLELSKSEIAEVGGGNPVAVIVVYAVVRYAAPRIAAALATGALGGATTGYLESDS